jgi:2-succinyl-6-hydroxy-2,4-cyclohexadiene-1-carboxylate synthase
MVSLDLQASRYRGGLEYLTLTPQDAIDPPILIFHGFTQSAWSMLRISSEIATRSGHRCILLNLPGHQDLVELPSPQEYFGLLEHHFPEAHLLGYSMGGRIAAWYGTSHPNRVRSMTLISTNVGIANPEERHKRVLADGALADEIERGGRAEYPAFLSRWDSQPLFSGRSVSIQSQRVRLSRSPAGVAAALRLYSTGQQPDLSRELLTQHYPLTLIVGTDDRKYVEGAQLMHEWDDSQRVSVVIVDQAGHDVPTAQPEAVIALVVAKLGGRRNPA